MAVLKCKMCEGNLDYILGQDIKDVFECPYCGTRQTIPSDSLLSKEKTLKMIERADAFRKQCDFDKALESFEDILSAYPNDPEIYWSMVLCRYGVEYIEDPYTGKMIPTCHRTQFNSILNDPDYLSAINLSNSERKDIYEKEALYIDSIQKKILEIANKEEPYDIFICYKESDEFNNRTQDSVMAQDIYYQLVQEGYRVFFSRITLESHIGVEYEPFIFSALNSAKVMIVVGTKPEYFNATWVKNEWSRYLRIIKDDKNKLIIPCYKNMNPYHIPKELSRYQSLDMSKIGFIQDLIRGLKKVLLLGSNTGNTIVIEQSNPSAIKSLLIRVYQFIEMEEWNRAEEYIEKILDINPENADAYVAKLMVKRRVSDKEKLSECTEPLVYENSYKMAVRYADDNLRNELEHYNHIIEQHILDDNNNKIREDILKLMESHEKNDLKTAKKKLKALGEWQDASELLAECIGILATIKTEEENEKKEPLYNELVAKLNKAKKIKELEEVKEKFIELGDYKDSMSLVDECDKRINQIHLNSLEVAYYNSMECFRKCRCVSDYENVKARFVEMDDYRDSRYWAKACECWIDLLNIEPIKKKYQCVEESDSSFAKEINRRYIVAKNCFDTCRKIDDYETVKKQFEEIEDYDDTKDLIKECDERIKQLKLLKIQSARKKSKIIRTVIVSVVWVPLTALATMFALLCLTEPSIESLCIFLIFVPISIFGLLKLLFCFISFIPWWNRKEDKPFLKLIFSGKALSQSIIRIVIQASTTIVCSVLYLVYFSVMISVWSENSTYDSGNTTAVSSNELLGGEQVEENSVNNSNTYVKEDYYEESVEDLSEEAYYEKFIDEKPIAPGEEAVLDEFQMVRNRALDYSFSGDIGTTQCFKSDDNSGEGYDMTLKEVFLSDYQKHLTYDMEDDQWYVDADYDSEMDDTLFLVVTIEIEDHPLAILQNFGVRSDYTGVADISPTSKWYLEYADGSWEIMTLYEIGKYDRENNTIEIRDLPDTFRVGGYYPTLEFHFQINEDVPMSQKEAEACEQHMEEVNKYLNYLDYNGCYSDNTQATVMDFTLYDAVKENDECGCMKITYDDATLYWKLYYTGGIGYGLFYAEFDSGDYEAGDYYLELRSVAPDYGRAGYHTIDMNSVEGTETLYFYSEY